ncbi:universal stress protein [Mycolicibacterium sp.]|uniref:universal stress protein n=1 Tax=Mycolicibacterium sp. TaxID=2320850 RepID=UPI001A1C6DD9|nr:universal stress protein [Mycolicibacterium sp.]MBJ7338146.1 universal stress protein [Mycolicibacterium sp.]
MTKSKGHYGIVVGVDGSPAATAAVQWAVRDAELRNVPLTLVHVLSMTAGTWLGTPVPADWTRRQREYADHVIDEAAKVARASGTGPPLQINRETPTGGMVSVMVAFSKGAELVVVGRRGMGKLRGRPMGSVSSAVVHHAHCPVAVIHDEAPPMEKSAQAPVLVGIDGSRGAELATAIAFDEASRRSVDLVAVHAWSDIGVLALAGIGPDGIGTPARSSIEDEVFAERLAGFAEHYPDVSVQRESVRNDPATVLIDESRRAQLTVVGGHGIGGFAGMLLGSVSTAVVQLAQSPVIVAHRRT